MEIDVQLTAAPITDLAPLCQAGDVGAWVEFRGLVRDEENGSQIAALEYEAYAPMAERKIRDILLEIAQTDRCLAARVVHRTGVVPVGEAAIYVGIAGPHRGEAFKMLARFMDRLKQDVPIWKVQALASLVTARVPAVSLLPQQKPTVPRPAAHSSAEVLQLLPDLCGPLETEQVQLADALGRVLREPVRAPEDQPSFDRSSVDGYAVRSDDLRTQFQLVDEIRAGEWKCRELSAGQTVRIATGAALPGPDLQVLMKEDVVVEGDMVKAVRRDGERNIRSRGEDARAGQVLVSPGTVLQHGTIALLASVGCTQPLVARYPRVLHVATGNEIISPEQHPKPGQIRDSNSALVRAFLGGWGIVPDQRRVGEDEEAIRAALNRQLAREWPDLLLISGGASVGEHDFTRDLLERAGFTIHVSKTTARPGKPLIVAQRGHTLAFGLPGNPLAHFVCLNLYVSAALRAWQSLPSRSVFEEGVLASDLPAGGNARETFWPGRWDLKAGRVELTPLRWSSSGDLTSLAFANALLRVSSGTEIVTAGSKVEFMRTQTVQ